MKYLVPMSGIFASKYFLNGSLTSGILGALGVAKLVIVDFLPAISVISVLQSVFQQAH